MEKWNTIKDILPWLLGVIGTIAALNKEWIQNSFSKKKNEVDIQQEKENKESIYLANTNQSLQIFKDMLDYNTDYYNKRITELDTSFKKKVSELEDIIKELDSTIKEQKLFIAKQDRSLKYYEKNFGKIKEE